MYPFGAVVPVGSGMRFLFDMFVSVMAIYSHSYRYDDSCNY
jgi:hypothetical protein